MEHTDPELASLDGQLSAAVARGDQHSAALLTHALFLDRLRAGRVDEALALAEEQSRRTERAGFGPWTRTMARSHRLHLLAGDPAAALAEARRLLAETAGLPETSAEPEVWTPGQVREAVHGIAADAASRLGDPEAALAHLDEVLRSRVERDAPRAERLEVLFDHHVPLRALGRSAEAREVLLRCLAEAGDDHVLCARAHHALANVEHVAGRGEPALHHARDGVRHAHLSGVPALVSQTHDSLGYYLAHHTGRFDEALAHSLGAAVVDVLTGRPASLDYAVGAVGMLPDDSSLPARWDRVCELVARSSDVRLDRLTADPAVPQQALEVVLTEVRRRDSALLGTYLSLWLPVVDGIRAAWSGDGAAEGAVREVLAGAGARPDWAALGGQLRRVLDSRSVDGPFECRDRVDRLVLDRAVEVLGGRRALPEGLWRLIPDRGVLSAAHTAAVRGRGGPLPGDDTPFGRALRRIVAGERGDDLLLGIGPPHDAGVRLLLDLLGEHPLSGAGG